MKMHNESIVLDCKLQTFFLSVDLVWLHATRHSYNQANERKPSKCRNLIFDYFFLLNLFYWWFFNRTFNLKEEAPFSIACCCCATIIFCSSVRMMRLYGEWGHDKSKHPVSERWFCFHLISFFFFQIKTKYIFFCRSKIDGLLSFAAINENRWCWMGRK